MVKRFGIEFAPTHVPRARRLQTLSVLAFPSLTLLFGHLVMIGLIFLLFTPFMFIPILYSIWFAYDMKTPCRGGRFRDSVRRWKIWTHFRDYFPVTIIKTADLEPTKNYIFGSHPHGIMCAGAFANFGTEANKFSELFPGIRPHLLTLDLQFRFPVYREIVLSTGTCSASKESIEWLLTKEGQGNALVLVVGGAIEALDAVPGKMELYLKPRKGFVKLAIKHGASLVPVISFGENDIFNQTSHDDSDLFKKVQLFLVRIMKISMPMFHGRGIFQYTLGFLPFRKPIVTVVGKPIDVIQNTSPTREEVERLHKQYIDSLLELYNAHKDGYGGKEVQMKIK